MTLGKQMSSGAVARALAAHADADLLLVRDVMRFKGYDDEDECAACNIQRASCSTQRAVWNVTRVTGDDNEDG